MLMQYFLNLALTNFIIYVLHPESRQCHSYEINYNDPYLVDDVYQKGYHQENIIIRINKKSAAEEVVEQD